MELELGTMELGLGTIELGLGIENSKKTSFAS